MFDYGYYGGGYRSFSRSGWSNYLDDNYGFGSPFSFGSGYGGFGGFGGGYGRSAMDSMMSLFSSFGQIKDIQSQLLEIAYLTGDNTILEGQPQYEYQAPTGTETQSTTNQLDLNGDGKIDVQIAGQDAEELADYIRQLTEQNPEMAQALLAKGAKNADGICYIDIQDLGGTTAGASRLDEKGQAWGSMFIDDTWKTGGINGLANTLNQVLER